MPIRPGVRYRPSPYQRPLFQGDILDGVPVLAMPPNQGRWILLLPTGTMSREEVVRGKRPKAFLPRSEESVADAWSLSAEAVVAKASKIPVILVTQTCDLDWRKHYQVAPVKGVSGLDEPKLRSLQTDEIGYWYYLPARPPEFPNESYADLTNMTSVHRSYFDAARILCRFTNKERSYFQSALADFHGSPFGFGFRDRVPETGRYGCLSCFHSGVFETTEIEVGGAFPECRRCGQAALWVLIGG